MLYFWLLLHPSTSKYTCFWLSLISFNRVRKPIIVTKTSKGYGRIKSSRSSFIILGRVQFYPSKNGLLVFGFINKGQFFRRFSNLVQFNIEYIFVLISLSWYPVIHTTTFCCFFLLVFSGCVYQISEWLYSFNTTWLFFSWRLYLLFWL